MKKLLFLFGTAFFLSCSSDDNNTTVDVINVFDPNISVNGDNFEIKLAGIYSNLSEGRKFTQFVLDNTDEVCVRCGTPPNYKRIILNVDSVSSGSIEGTYDLSQPANEIRNISAGYYLSGYPIYLYSGLVTITKLSDARYKVEFNNVKGRFYLNDSSPTNIEGYFDGNFATLENRYWQM